MIQMREPRPPEPPVAPLDLTLREGVETPEHVEMRFELAGLGSRAAAALIDTAILTAALLVMWMVFSLVGTAIGVPQQTVLVFMLVVFLLTVWGYFLFYEGRYGGQTPGKRRLGVRVVLDTGQPITWTAAVVRNLVRFVDMQPGGTYGVGAVSMVFHRRARRLGDVAAGTMVVRDRPVAGALAEERAAAPTVSGEPELSDEEFGLLERFLARVTSLDAPAADRLRRDLVARFAPRVRSREPDQLAFLQRIYDEDAARRRARVVAATPAGAAGRSRVAAERFVARKRERWEEYRRWAQRLEADGISRMRASDIPEFAARYREAAADLARGRTYGVDPGTLASLERAVAAGHNALYRSRRWTRRAPVRTIRSIVRACVRRRGYVAVAFLLFLLPGVAGYGAVRGAPTVARTILPPEMVARAEAGAQRSAEGRRYVEVPSMYMPLMATALIGNNVQVAIAAFALGITAGLGTVVVLAFNGWHIGAILGLFANYGLAGYLLAFIVAHGPLELTAIFLAGGAGLMLGRAILAPGDLPRREALVIAGRDAVRLMGAAAALLVVAGVIEGFVSAGPLPWPVKAGIGAVGIVCLAAAAAVGLKPLPEESPASDGRGPRFP